MRRTSMFAVAIPLALLGLGLAASRLVADPTPAKGTIVAAAGSGPAGYSGDGGPAVQARLNMPYGAAISPTGSLYFAEIGSHVVRRVNPDGTIVTVAGTGKPGYFGDNGPSSQARLHTPLHLAFDSAGNLYIADAGNRRVRKVSPDGIISTIAGGGRPADRLGDGGLATQAQLSTIRGLAIDTSGNLYIGDTENHRVRRVGQDGIITTVAGTGKQGSSGDGGPANQAQFAGPAALALDAVGNLYIVEYGPSFNTGKGHRVRRMSADGTITTVAGSGEKGFSGDGGPAVEATFNFITGIAADTEGSLFIADWGNYRVRKVSPNGTLTTEVGNGQIGFAADGVAATASGLRGPWALTIDGAGNLYIADTFYGKEDQKGAGERVLKLIGGAAPGLLAGLPFQSP